MFSNALFLTGTKVLAAAETQVRGWAGFEETLKNFFKDGMGQSGAKGLGIALVIIGLFMGALSFAMHHFNPQSRMPSWGICLAVAVVGSILTFGLDKPVNFFKSVGEWIQTLLGV